MSREPSAAPVLTPSLVEALQTLSTATLTHQLQMRGIRSSFFSGLRPLHPALRMVTGVGAVWPRIDTGRRTSSV